MKITFKDSNIQYFEEDVIVLDLDYIPKVGDSVFFDQIIVPETYLDFAKRYGFIVKAQEAYNETIYGTVKAIVQSVNHIFKPQRAAQYVAGVLIPADSGHTVEIEIDFNSERSNGTGDDPSVE